MGGGTTSRGGFYFQDLVLADRVLRHLVASRKASADDAPACESPEFRIEGPGASGEGPDWDLVERCDGSVLLEEVKRGQLGADDRRVLWRRVRQTVGTPGIVAGRVRVRLTVNGANPPDNPDRWRALAVTSQRAPATWASLDADGGRRPAVRNAEDLASEALFWLTRPEVDAARALTESEARELLTSFVFNEEVGPDALEDAARASLRDLTGDVGVEDVLRALQGHIAQRAASDEPAAHRFTGEELGRSVDLIARLGRVDAETVALWRRIIQRSDELLGEPEPIGGLSYQPWREVQPQAVERLGRCEGRIVLLGRGGQGKSVLLRRWLDEQRVQGAVAVWLSGADLLSSSADRLSAAIELGAFSARRDGRRLVVVLDALEGLGSVGDTQRALAGLALTAAPDLAVLASCRTLEWRGLRGSQESISGWDTLEMSDWSEERVRVLIQGSQRSNVGTDVLRLLRTPLLLDLFLRTFGRDEPIPAGLQSRHALLRAYWDRRVLPEDERGVERRALLVSVAAEEARGNQAHAAVGPPALDLTSEGLFALVRGQRVFRHALLRDFTMMMWALDGCSGSRDIATKLSSIGPRLIQFGALRATLEAASEPIDTGACNLTVAEVVAELAPVLALDAATVLGELDDARGIDLERLVSAIPVERSEPFVRAVLRASKIALNPEGLRYVARLSSTLEWASRTTWLGSDVVLEVAALVDVIQTRGAPDALPSSLRRELAERLRVWSTAPTPHTGLAANGAFGIGKLIRLVVRLDPSRKTSEWLAWATPLGACAKQWTLSELPALVRGSTTEGEPIDEALLASLYCTAGDLQWEGGRLRDAIGLVRNGMTDFDRIDHALQGGAGGAAGQGALLAAHPRAFVPIALGLLAGHEADQQVEREARSARVQAALAPLLQALVLDEPEDIVETLTRSARAIVSAPEYDVAPGELVVDDLTEPYDSLVEPHYGGLVCSLRVMAERSLTGGTDFFDDVFAPAVAKSSSVIARVCALDLLTRSAPNGKPFALDLLLTDPRIYLVKAAHVYLQRAIAQRWSDWDSPMRQAVLHNIVGSGRSAVLGVLTPGPLLAAVPLLDRPPELRLFLQLYEERGWSLELEERSGIVGLGDPRRPLATPRAEVSGMSALCQSHWNDLTNSVQGLQEATDPAWAALLELVTRITTEFLPSATVLLGHVCFIDSLAQFLRVHAWRHRKRPGAPVLSESVVRALTTWALAAADELPATGWVRNVAPSDGVSAGLPAEGEVWAAMVAIADAGLRDERLEKEPTLNDRLFGLVEALPRRIPGRLAHRLFDTVWGWARAPGKAKTLLRSLLVERVKDSGALCIGLRFLEWLPVEDQAEILRCLLTTQCDLDGLTAQFARVAGGHVGQLALTRYPDGRTTGSARVGPDLLACRSSEGLLSSPENFETFVSQFAYGCRTAVAAGAVPVERAGEYVLLVEACWRALRDLEYSSRRENHAAAFALWVFDPVLNARAKGSKNWSDAELGTWWNALDALAASIVRDGPWREVASLMRLLRESRLLDLIEGGCVRSHLSLLGERLAKLPPDLDYHQHDAVATAAVVAERLAGGTRGASRREELYALASAWGAPPLAIDEAAAAARRMRERGND